MYMYMQYHLPNTNIRSYIFKKMTWSNTEQEKENERETFIYY